MCGFGCLSFRLKMSTLVCEVMKVYVVKMSKCPPVKLVSLCAVDGLLAALVIIITVREGLKINFQLPPL